MKPADPSSEHRSSTGESRAGVVLEKPSNGKGREEAEPKYVDVPWQRQRRSYGNRNLVWGVLILIVSVALLVQAIALVGGRAAVPLGTALLTLVALFVLMRSRVLRQRNGGFVALSVVCLLATLVPLAELGGSRLASSSKAPTVQPAIQGVTPGSAIARNELPLLTQAYNISIPDQNGARFKVLRDLRVVIDEKAHLIKAGEILPLGESGDGEVRFAAGGQQIALPSEFVEVLKPGDASAQPAGNQPEIAAAKTPAASTSGEQADPSTPPADPSAQAGDPAAMDEPELPQDETPAQITQRAQKEAIRRYPALGQKNSPENQLFVETVKELRHSGADDFFADPQWPLQLAEMLAKRGWRQE